MNHSLFLIQRFFIYLFRYVNLSLKDLPLSILAEYDGVKWCGVKYFKKWLPIKKNIILIENTLNTLSQYIDGNRETSFNKNICIVGHPNDPKFNLIMTNAKKNINGNWFKYKNEIFSNGFMLICRGSELFKKKSFRSKFQFIISWSCDIKIIGKSRPPSIARHYKYLFEDLLYLFYIEKDIIRTSALILARIQEAKESAPNSITDEDGLYIVQLHMNALEKDIVFYQNSKIWTP